MVVQQSNLSAWLRPRPSHAPIQAGPSNGHIGQPGQTKQTPIPDTTLTVVHWNAEGVSNKKIELQEFLRKHEVDVIYIITELNNLPQSSQVALQWIPSHCGIAGNEIADTLSKTGSNQNQYSHPVDYKEAKTIIRNKCRTDWKHRLQIDNRLDPIQLLSRHAQTTIFRLRTGHCRLRSHLYRLGITHTDECNCGEGVQTPEHLLQDCSTHTMLRRTTWPQEQDLESKLWGSLEDLDRTVGFILAMGEKI
ncbi:hypothetical protein BsWGS_12083 [Bradybaena similaris]